MALSDFFRINLPYGLAKNSNNQWFVFNREYMTLGWNSRDYHNTQEDTVYSNLPVYTKYKGLTETAILKIIKNKDRIQRNEQNEIVRVFFYNDKTNPKSNLEYWSDYMDIIKSFSQFEKSSAV